MSKLFIIEKDLLGLISFLDRGGNNQVQYGAGTCWWLRHISELTDFPKGFPPQNIIGDHIVTLAFDNIPWQIREVLCAYALGLCSLIPATNKYLRERGFIYGVNPKLPERVRQHCYDRVKLLNHLKENVNSNEF